VHAVPGVAGNCRTPVRTSRSRALLRSAHL